MRTQESAKINTAPINGGKIHMIDMWNDYANNKINFGVLQAHSMVSEYNQVENISYRHVFLYLNLKNVWNKEYDGMENYQEYDGMENSKNVANIDNKSTSRVSFMIQYCAKVMQPIINEYPDNRDISAIFER